MKGAGGLRRLGTRDDARALGAALDEAETLRAQAREEGRAECAAWLVAARAAYARSLAAEEATVIALACEVARAVLGREAAASPAVLRDVTAQAMTRLRRARRVALRVHPDDAEEARRGAGGWLPEGSAPEEILVVADPSVDRGGVVVETELGRVDARLGRQIDAVARILTGQGVGRVEDHGS